MSKNQIFVRNIDQALFSAVKKGDVAAINASLDAGANIHAFDSTGMKVAHLVPYEDSARSIAVLKLLLGRGADIGAVSEKGYNSPLQSLMEKLHHWKTPEGGKAYNDQDLRAILTLFKQQNVNFNALNAEDQSPVFYLQDWFVKKAHLNTLAEFGVQFDLPGFEGRTLAHTWAERPDMEGLEFLATHGVPLNVTDEHGNTPLHAFVKRDLYTHKPLTEDIKSLTSLLYNCGVDLDARDHHGHHKKPPEEGRTAVDVLKTSSVKADQDHGAELEAIIDEVKKKEREYPAMRMPPAPKPAELAATPAPQVTNVIPFQQRVVEPGPEPEPSRSVG